VEAILNGLDPKHHPNADSLPAVKVWQTNAAKRFLLKYCNEPGEEPNVKMQNGIAWIHLGRVHQVLGDYTEAHNAFIRAVELFEPLTTIITPDAKYAIIEHAIRGHPQNDALRRILALLYLKWKYSDHRDLIAAKENAMVACSLEPRNTKNILTLGLAHYHLKEWLEVIHTLQPIIGSIYSTPSEITHAHFLLAVAFGRTGDRAAALDSYNAGLKVMREGGAHRNGLFELKAAIEIAIGNKLESSVQD
jgi:tetratricopeptide (TPR) repeat protein